MRIILFGPPGSGKGTQAQFIMKKYNIQKISTGDILRTTIKSNSRLGENVRCIMNSGQLVFDELIISLVRERIYQKDCQNGFLLDGFPRTILQANAIKKAGIDIDYVLEFCLPNQLVIDRIIGRRIHLPSGRIYHTKFNQPIVEGKDDITGEPLIIRDDDNEKTIRKRLAEYNQMTMPLISYYTQEAKLNNIKYIKIDSTKSIIDIHTELEKIF